MTTLGVDVVMASTNEPELPGILASWSLQTHDNFWVDVCVDKFSDHREVYGRVGLLTTDPRFRFYEHVGLQGLVKVWNRAWSKKRDYRVLTAGDYVYPSNFLETCVRILQAKPEIGFLMPSNSENSSIWSLVMTKDCAEKVGPLSDTFGSGGLAMWFDWQLRARAAGFQGGILRNMQVYSTSYSVQWQHIKDFDLEDWPAKFAVIDDEAAFMKKYGFGIFFTHGFAYLGVPFVDNDGNVCHRYSDILSSEELSRLDTVFTDVAKRVPRFMDFDALDNYETGIRGLAAIMSGQPRITIPMCDALAHLQELLHKYALKLKRDVESDLKASAGQVKPDLDVALDGLAALYALMRHWQTWKEDYKPSTLMHRKILHEVDCMKQSLERVAASLLVNNGG